ncbi:MAG: hypothetical protein RLZZ584_226, partial [Pseudomonadota bacterium]
MPLLRLPMLDRSASYRLRQVEPAGSRGRQLYDTTTPWLQALRGDADGVGGGCIAHGAWLAEAGLAVPRSKAETAFLLHLQRV